MYICIYVWLYVYNCIFSKNHTNKNLTSHFIIVTQSLGHRCGITKSCLHSSSVHNSWVSLPHWLPPQFRAHLRPLSMVGSDQRVSVRVTVNIKPVRSFTNTKCDGTAWSSLLETVIKSFGINKRLTKGQNLTWTKTTNYSGFHNWLGKIRQCYK